ncbi:tRNA (adenosine(37)-N6)-dimethylallyltransferase MiaA [Candidatus Babeliales bacterium]|nr:tRNA (adenosine(37)-N6)-dimethylallyltransferase MiaA [Candidatus Babeliales bacterium]
MEKFIIIVSGPTACGKTDLVYRLGQLVSIEIINADIGSMYQPLTIGTAKPDWKKSNITHHGFDIFNQPEQFSMAQFRILVQKLIVEIWNRGNTPVIVGGSTMYIKSLLFNMHILPDTKIAVRGLLKDLELKILEKEALWQQLNCYDPLRASQIHKNDTYRLVQALAIWKTTHKKPSTFGQFFDPLAKFCWISVQRDRAQLYDHINKRVSLMMEQGWRSEVAALQHTAWANFLMQKKIIGYDDMLMNLSSESAMEYDILISTIQQKTRHYAKRQIIFFKKIQTEVRRELLNKPYIGSVHDLDLTLCDDGLYIKGLLKQILQNLK